MPELPEVEVVVRSLAPYVTGQTIHSAHFRSKFVTPDDFSETAHSLAGQQILGIERHGKHILFPLASGFLHVHLGMTGRLLWNGVPGRHTHAALTLSNGILYYDDIRQFGRVGFFPALPPTIRQLGPDPLTLDLPSFRKRLSSRRGALKPLLLNQSFLGGLGNIYVDEILHRARLHPLACVPQLSRAEVARLHRSCLAILRLAIAHRGSSISDYVDGDGLPGSFQQLHQVYGRTGQACRRCGGLVVRMVIAQRGTHVCPRCQQR